MRIRRVRQGAALLLAIVLVWENPLQVLAQNETVASEQDFTESETADEEMAASETEPVSSPDGEEIVYEAAEETTVSGENNQTIKELTEYRDEYSKFYQMPDHSIQACVYAEPIHYREPDSDSYLTINNRLYYKEQAFSGAGTISPCDGYENTANRFHVTFAAVADASHLFAVSENGIRIAMRYQKHNDHDVFTESISEESISAEAVSAEQGTENTGSDFQSRIILTDPMEAEDPATNNDKANKTEQLTGQDTKQNAQQVSYENIEENVSFQYSLLSEGVKEEIILQKKPKQWEWLTL